MSVNVQRHVQFPRRQQPETSVYSGGSAAKDTCYLAVRRVSPESGGFAAGALPYYVDHKTESEEVDYVSYQNQVRRGIQKRDQHHSRSQQDSQYDMKYQYSLNRSSEFDHSRKEHFRNETSPEMSPLITTEASHFAHNRSCRKSSRHQSSPVNEIYERSFHRYPNKRSYCLERESSPGHDYSHVQRSERKRSSSRRNRQHNRPNKRRVHSPSPPSSRPHRHQRSNQNSSSDHHSRTGKSHRIQVKTQKK